MQNSLKMPLSLSSAFLVLGYGERPSSPCRQRPNLPRCRLSRESLSQFSPLAVARPDSGFRVLPLVLHLPWRFLLPVVFKLAVLVPLQVIPRNGKNPQNTKTPQTQYRQAI
jgi:hypothetical protein